MKAYSPDAIANAVKAVQYGDLATVRSLVQSGQVSASSVDNDGCSLLHWAAINNRVAITNFLIQNGALVPCAGGVLAESPLHWAARRGFLRIAELLLNNGADITYRSSLGLDALNVATRIGIVNTVFYLLAKGADPDSRPPDGDTPLLWCLKNRSASPDLIRLLLRHGADPCVPDSEGCTAYHVLAAMGGEVDSTIWTALYTAGAHKTFWMKNKAGQYPYQVAVASRNIFMLRYLWDVWADQYVPAKVTGLCTTLSVMIVPYFLHLFGLVKGILLMLLLQVVFFDKIAMPYVPRRSMMFNFYIAVGVTISLFVLYLIYIKNHISTASNVLLLGGSFLSIGLWYLCTTTPPRTIPHTSINDVLHDLVDFGPREGPEEAASNNDGSTADGTSEGDVEKGNGPADHDLESESHGLLASRHGGGSDSSVHATPETSAAPRRRRLAAHFDVGLPRDPFNLCTTCVGDKGMGTHCFRCNKCVVDMDNHCLVTMTCVGRGNRRLHLLFEVTVATVCLLYLILAIHVEHYVHCSDATGMLWGLIAVQRCIWSSDPAFAAAPLVLLLLINYAGILAVRLLRNVALETTVVDMNKKRNRFKSLSNMSRKEIFNKIVGFLLTGKYPLARRTIREVEEEEAREAAQAAEMEARIEELRQMHQGRYRQGSFDLEDASGAPNPVLSGSGPGTSTSNSSSAIGQIDHMARR